MQNKELNLIDYLILLYRKKSFIIYVFLAVSITAAIIAFISPKWYKAEAVVIPNRAELPFTNEPSGLLSMTALFGEISESKRYIAILKSRTTMERIIREFNLQKVYETEDIEETLKELESNIDFDVDEEGTIRVTVLDKLPQRSSDMANQFIHILNETNKRLNQQDYDANIEYIKARFQENIDTLRIIEEKFKNFQEKYNIISLPEQTEAMITTAADLYAEVKMLEIELGSKRKILSKDHTEIRSLETRLREHQKSLNELMTKSEKSLKNPQKDELSYLFIPMDEIPAIGIKYIELKRNLEAQQTIYDLLVEQLEIAKLLKSAKSANLQIIDMAVPPIKKYKPKRGLIILLSGFSSLIISSLFIIVIEYFKFKANQN